MREGRDLSGGQHRRHITFFLYKQGSFFLNFKWAKKSNEKSIIKLTRRDGSIITFRGIQQITLSGNECFREME